MSSSNNYIKAKEYEDFLISEKKDSLKTLIADRIEYRHIKIIQKILKYEFTNELISEINKIIKYFKFFSYNILKVLLFKYSENFPKKRNL